jgi:hypothetical protein
MARQSLKGFMAVPWFRVLDAVIGVTDLALRGRGGRRPADDVERRLASGASAPGTLETRLAGVVVAALKEAFERDSRRLDLERELAEAENVRAERALRLELRRQAGDRELARLRLIVVVAVASWIGTLLFSVRLIGGSLGARAALGAGWALLLAAVAAAFAGQSSAGRGLALIDLDRDGTVPSGVAGTLAPWFIVLGLALIGLSVLIA